MANQSAKKRFAENKRVVRNLWTVVVVAHVLAVVLGAGVPLLRRGTVDFRWGCAVAHCLNSGVMLLMARLISALAQPSFDAATGELKDGGADLSMPGALSSYYFDLVYMTSFAMVMAAAFGPRWWLVHVVTAAGVLYVLYTNLLAPALAARKAAQPDEPAKSAAPAPGRNREERRRLAKEQARKRN